MTVTPRRSSTGGNPLVLLVLATLVPVMACGGEAESAADETSSRVEIPVADVPAEPVPPIVQPAPTLAADPAPQPTVVARSPRPPQRPAEAPAPTGTIVVAEPPPPERVPLFVPAGVTLEASVEGELSTERSTVGDRFYAILKEDVLGPQGEILLAAGSRINARVAASVASAGADQPAMLAVAVESITSAGRTLPLSARVVELEAEVQARDSNTRTAAKVGVGVAAGALVGRILGNDGRDAAKGAVAGAAAGAAVAIATRDGHAVVKPGARMVIRLEERLVVEE